MNKKSVLKKKKAKLISFGNGYINALEVFKLFLTDEVDKSKTISESEINKAIDRTHKMLADDMKEQIGLEINFIKA
jgi:hypothetical protein